jgi:HEPN domain-containing protein
LIEKGKSTKPSSLISVAEIAAFATGYGEDEADDSTDEIEIDDLSDPLLRSINCVQHLVRAYRITTHSLVPEPTYQRLRPWILTATRAVDADGPPKTHSVTHLSHQNVRDAPPHKLEDRDLLQWQASVQLLSAKDPLSLYYERMIEAEFSVAVEGNYGAAVLGAAMASEIYLDSILALLLWERYGAAPSSDGPTAQAARAMSKDLRPRLRSEYHPLIGGRWDLKSNETLRAWDIQVARVRGRIVHRSYRPRPSEAADALNAVKQLVEYVTDLLTSKASEYPRTASMMVTLKQLGDRKVSARTLANMDKLARSEPPWRDNYSSWRDRVDAEVIRRGSS